jgi:hypothetical protein
MKQKEYQVDVSVDEEIAQIRDSCCEDSILIESKIDLGRMQLMIGDLESQIVKKKFTNDKKLVGYLSDSDDEVRPTVNDLKEE